VRPQILTTHNSEGKARRQNAASSAEEICAELGRALRSPVATALKRTRLAEQGLRETDDAAQARALVDAVNRAVQRLDAIITRIIRHARRPRRGSPGR
jgi:hypothetical protein